MDIQVLDTSKPLAQNSDADAKVTPAMRQFNQAKIEVPDAIILFRMGDFYECFHNDAKDVSRILNITLTTRGKDDVPLAGIPYHALDRYLKQLVSAGRKIAICEQLEDPKLAKGVVKRGITRIITPGTLIEDSLLTQKANNFLLSLTTDGSSYAYAYCDVSTGIFHAGESQTKDAVLTTLSRVNPSEVAIAVSFADADILQYLAHNKIYVAKLSDFMLYAPKATKVLQDHFGEKNFHLSTLATQAAGGLLSYLKETQKVSLNYITTIQKQQQSEFVILDSTTIRNLEIIKSLSDGSRDYSLLATIDKTVTSMGGRLFRQWLLYPLTDIHKISERHHAIEQLLKDTLTLEELRSILGQMSDIERLLSKITYGLANARDVVNLKQTLLQLPSITNVLSPIIHSATQNSLLEKLVAFPDIRSLIQRIDQALKDECPTSIREGGFIKRGFNAELDELWSLKDNATEYLAKLESEEIQKTGIPTLKIKYNRVVGYYIEVSSRYLSQIPADYQRKASTVNGERFVTPQLKELEHKILTSQERIEQLEYNYFIELTKEILTHTNDVQQVSYMIASIDCVTSLSLVAQKNRYVKPTMTNGYELVLKDGRHPVVESFEQSFISNDTQFNPDERMIILTGPNMAGKSTFMRQVAIITLLAHIGSFVPTTSATIGIVDRIFTRVGAYDNLARGQSTFMVEMAETASILSHATTKSLLILDEIGSATSTYDGVAIAWAVALDIARRIGAKTIFSTHYHVLTRLGLEKGVVNYKVSVLEKEGDIIFLHKVVRGGTDKSYGLHVAKLAGVPAAVLEQARKIQIQLEDEDKNKQQVVVEKRSNDPESVMYVKVKQRTLLDE